MLCILRVHENGVVKALHVFPPIPHIADLIHRKSGKQCITGDDFKANLVKKECI